jgi:hypothetical protein
VNKTEEDKEQNQQRTFNAFLLTLPYESRSSEGWISRGLGPPIDFIHKEERIGVELTEWRGMEQSQWVEERDRFRAELQTAIKERLLSHFNQGGAGYTVEIQLEDGPPRRATKPEVIADFLSFLDDFVRTKRSRFSPRGIAYMSAGELPVLLQPVVYSITVWVLAASNIGIFVRAKQDVFDPAALPETSNVAINSFRQRLVEKAVKGADKYIREKERLQLRELWLIVHYSSPDVFSEPLSELGMEIGCGARISQEAVAAKLKAVAQEIGGGPFDRVYFLVDCQPEPFSELIFP